MRNIQFHKRNKESNVGKINLRYKSECIKSIDFSDYQLFKILYDVAEMLERGDSKETTRDYIQPYIHLYTTEENIDLDEFVNDRTEKVNFLENTNLKLQKKIESLKQKIKALENKIQKNSRSKGKEEDLDINEILKEGLGQ